MKTFWWRKPVDRSVTLLGTVALVAVVGQLALPAQAPARTMVVVPIESLALVCPALPANMSGYAVHVHGALTDTGTPAVLDLQTPKGTRSTVRAPGVTTVGVTRSGSALFSAQGASATELVAGAEVLGTTSPTRGYATYPCQPPTVSQWLIGGATTPGRTSVLYIANVDATQATVDLDVWSDLGKSSARSLSGITIPPRSVEPVSLALVEPARAMYVVHVTATSGQVTSAMLETGQKALASLGVDVVPSVQAPMTQSVLGVLPAGTKWAHLGLLSPGTATAVHVSLVTSDGTYPLAGAENLALEADKVTLVSIPDDALVGDAVVRVEADAPIVAGIGAQLIEHGAADLASMPMMSTINRVASITVDAGVSEAMALLHSSSACSVTLRVTSGGATSTKTVSLAPYTITRVKLFGGSGTSRIVTVAPSSDGVMSGSVLLRRSSAGGVGTTVEPLVSIRGYVAVPPIAPDIAR